MDNQTSSERFDQLLDYRAALLERLDRQPAELARAIAALPESQWQSRRDARGRSPHSIAAHVRDLEALAYLPWLRQIASEIEPRLQPDPFDHWSVTRYDAAEEMPAILADWSRTRADMTHLLRTLPPGGWSRTGFYAPAGRRTLQWWAEQAGLHVRHHLEDLHGLSIHSD